ncbi:MAG: hypothetical protein ABL897_08160 [Hyphomicrobium sp.]
MSEVSDELLMSYADGELTGEDHARVAAYLVQSAEGAQRLAVFAATGKKLSGLFDQPMQEPVPPRLIAAVMGGVGGRVAEVPMPRADIIRLDAGRRVRPVLSRSNWMLAAACVTLVVAGAGVLSLLDQNRISPAGEFAVVRTTDGKIIASEQLARALEATPTGAVAASDIDGSASSIEPVFTFATASKDFCRQYVIERADAPSFGGVACREGKHQWRVEAHAAFAAKQSGSSAIRPAGKAVPEEIDAAVNRLISGDVLSTDAEATLLSSGWTEQAP